ncbi:hypothetical protein CFSAN002367_20682 [Clostridium botulinum CFSAN002367]|nr:hypothetical protein CFSAN002367_20682 [Clostridium botulinum CFSAN002367]
MKYYLLMEVPKLKDVLILPYAKQQRNWRKKILKQKFSILEISLFEVAWLAEVVTKMNPASAYLTMIL